MVEPVVKLKDIAYTYPDGTKVTVGGLDISIMRGERIAILGANGAGKTTLLLHILGLLSPTDGEITVLGKNPYKDFKDIRKDIGVVFQNVDEQIIGPTVYDDIGFTPFNDGMAKDRVDMLIKDIAQKMHIDGLLDKIVHYLSGGEKKKVALAAALVGNPEILILDEPFNGLDPRSKKELIGYIDELRKERYMTIITATHDIDLVASIADTVYILSEGNVVLKGDPGAVFSNREEIERANLEPPILTKLFRGISDEGYDLGIPKDVDEAKDIIINALRE